MKNLLLTAAMLAMVAAAGTGSGLAKDKPRMLDTSKPEDALEVAKRVQCGEADGKPAVYHWAGKVYARVTGEPDRLLFTGEGMNVRTCVAINDPKRGRGWRMVSREIMLYLDPKTGEVLREWTNPWTDEKVPVMQIANDPVNQRAQFPYAADGTPYKFSGRREGRWILQPFEAPLFYNNPLAGDYQEYVGNKYHAMEIFNFSYDAEEMLNTKNATAFPVIAWVRISDWMPWMKMRGRQGQLVFNAMGNKLKSYDELPAVLKDEIALNYPIYTTPPPTDDARPNETTWTVFKKWSAERGGAKPTSGGH